MKSPANSILVCIYNEEDFDVANELFAVIGMCIRLLLLNAYSRIYLYLLVVRNDSNDTRRDY